MIRSLTRNLLLFFVVLLNFIPSQNSTAQNSGGFLLMPENFYTQMLNPAFMRNDFAPIVALPVFAGVSIENTGNFKISDLLYRIEKDNVILDLKRFDENSKSVNSISQAICIPLFYYTYPVEDGFVNFYINEHMYNSMHVPKQAITWFDYGNYPENYREYDSGKININNFGYMEIALGISKKVDKRLKAGIRGKVIFGRNYIDLENWDYSFSTSESGSEIYINSSGTGKLATPFSVSLDQENRIRKFYTGQIAGKYLSTVSNPGLAVDFGVSYLKTSNSEFSFSISDLGFVWFLQNSYKLVQDDSYSFVGFDVSNSLDNQTSGYISPLDVVIGTQDKLAKIFKPVTENKNFAKILFPKTFLQYKYDGFRYFTFGFTNQMYFQKNNIVSVSTASALQNRGAFQFFENISLSGINQISIGGGIQWTNRIGQLFFATNNVLAAYHPADQKSYAFTMGMNLLLDQDAQKKATKRNLGGGKGKFFSTLPFFKSKK